MKEFTKWTRKEFESLPTPKSYTNEEIGEVDSLVIDDKIKEERL